MKKLIFSIMISVLLVSCCGCFEDRTGNFRIKTQDGVIITDKVDDRYEKGDTLTDSDIEGHKCPCTVLGSVGQKGEENKKD